MSFAGYRHIIRRFATNSFWSLAGSGISQGLMLVVMIFIGRRLGPANLGRFGMIQMTVNLLGSLAGISLGNTSAKYVAEFRITAPEKAGRAIGLASLAALAAGVVLSGTLAIGAPFLARTTLHSPDMTGLLRAGAMWVFFIVLNAEQFGVLAGLENFKSLAHLNAVRGVAMLIGGGAGVFFGGVLGAVLGFTAAACLQCIVTAFYVHSGNRRYGIRAIYLSPDHDYSLITGFSLPSFLASVVALPVTWMASAILVNQSDGYSHMGLFNAAGHWKGVVSFLPAGLAQVGLPVLSNILGTRDRAAYRKAFLTLIVGLTLSAGSVTLVLCLSVNLLVRLYGNAFHAAGPIFIVVMVTAVISSVDWALAVALSSVGKMWSLTGLTVIWAVLVISLAYWWIPPYKAMGLAAAFLVAYALEVLLRGWYVYRSIWEKFTETSSLPEGHIVSPVEPVPHTAASN